MTFVMRGNSKPFGKRLSPCAETPNLSGNDFRQARKLQTIQEITFAMRGNSKPFGKRLSPCAETPNLSGNDFRQARKLQTIQEITFAMRGNSKPFAEWFAGGHIGAQETIETTIGIPLWITFNILRVECFSCYTTLLKAFGIVGK